MRNKNPLEVQKLNQKCRKYIENLQNLHLSEYIFGYRIYICVVYLNITITIFIIHIEYLQKYIS